MTDRPYADSSPDHCVDCPQQLGHGVADSVESIETKPELAFRGGVLHQSEDSKVCGNEKISTNYSIEQP
jgi:hypothetical protein